MPYTIDATGPIWKVVFMGTLSNDDLHRVALGAAEIEKKSPVVANRLVDMRQLEAIDIGFSEINDLARRRRSQQLTRDVKSAILTGSPVQYGFARMFQTILLHPQITVQVFSDEKDALEWLAT